MTKARADGSGRREISLGGGRRIVGALKRVKENGVKTTVLTTIVLSDKCQCTHLSLSNKCISVLYSV